MLVAVTLRHNNVLFSLSFTEALIYGGLFGRHGHRASDRIDRKLSFLESGKGFNRQFSILAKKLLIPPLIKTASSLKIGEQHSYACH